MKTRALLGVVLVAVLALISSHINASAIYRGINAASLPTITLTGDTSGTGAGGTIATTTTAINGVTYTAPLAAATLTGTLAWDNANTTGCASDANTTIQTTCGGAGVGPVVHYAELVRRWGTTAPFFNASTTVTALSTQPDFTDPVIFNPLYGAGVTVSLQCAAPTVITAGVSLSGTTAKSTAAGSNSLLITNLGATGAAAQWVDNTTHASRAFAYKSLGANSFSMTQPFVKLTIPNTTNQLPVEVNSWANSDSVNLLSPININLVSYVPVALTDNGFANSNANTAYLYQCGILAPTTRAPIALGAVRVNECSIARDIFVAPAKDTGAGGLKLANVLMTGGLIEQAGIVNVYGGAVTSTGLFQVGGLGAPGFGPTLELDFILGAGFGPHMAGIVTIQGNLYLDTSITVDTGSVNGGGSAMVIYGNASANILMQGASRWVISTGTFSSSFTAAALVSPGIQLNGSSTGCSHTNATPDVVSCGIATTPANLDGAAGATGFGGNAVSSKYGGASLGNAL